MFSNRLRNSSKLGSIYRLNIHLGEILGFMGVIKHGLNVVQWITILDCYLNEGLVINGPTPFIFFFLRNDEYWLATWRDVIMDVVLEK